MSFHSVVVDLEQNTNPSIDFGCHKSGQNQLSGGELHILCEFCQSLNRGMDLEINDSSGIVKGVAGRKVCRTNL